MKVLICLILHSWPFLFEELERILKTEELLGLQPMKGTTQGTDLFTSLIELLNKFKPKLTNLAGVATDGCPSMAVKNKGIVALVKKSKGDKNVIHYHCIIHQQCLCARGIGFKNVITL